MQAINDREARWSVDMDAYKRLRRDGEQPARIDGSAFVEKHAETRLEVEQSTVLDSRQRAAVRSLQSEGAL